MGGAEASSGSRIIGRVFEERGRRLGGVRVRCGGEEGMTLFDGSYRFDGLEAGIHVVEVDLEGYEKQSWKVETRMGMAATQDFHLEPKEGESRIFGRVLDAENRESIPQGGSVHMLHPASNRSAPIDPATGRYEFRGLPEGTYRLWTSVLHYADEERTVTLRREEERRVDFLCRKRKEVEPPWG